MDKLGLYINNLMTAVVDKEEKFFLRKLAFGELNKLNQDNFQIIGTLSEILQESGEIGEMELNIFKLNIKSLKTYEKDLIVCKTNLYL